MLVPCIQPLSHLIKRHSFSVHLIADDIKIETFILPLHVHSANSSEETCISGVMYWMTEKKLQWNDEKAERLLIRPYKCTQSLICTSLSFRPNVISIPTTVKNIGFHITDDMTIDARVHDICHKVYADIQRISSILHLLFIEATKTCSEHLCYQNYIIVIVFSMVVQHIHTGRNSGLTLSSNTNGSMSLTKSHFTHSHVSALTAL